MSRHIEGALRNLSPNHETARAHTNTTKPTTLVCCLNHSLNLSHRFPDAPSLRQDQKILFGLSQVVPIFCISSFCIDWLPYMDARGLVVRAALATVYGCQGPGCPSGYDAGLTNQTSLVRFP